MQRVADKHGVNTIKNKTTSLGGRGIIIRGNTVSPGVSRDKEKEVVFKEKKKKKEDPWPSAWLLNGRPSLSQDPLSG